MKIRVPIIISVKSPRTNKTIQRIRLLNRFEAIRTAKALLKQYNFEKYTHICKVLYSKKQDSWNKFEYSDIDTFKFALSCDLELVLLKDLVDCGMMEKKYLT